MEYLGTGFVLTIAGVRLRVRIALEETPDPKRDPPTPTFSARTRRPENAASRN
jgi:hypothetical protein